jgi:spermidine/putrescine transport system permease protein
MANPTIRPWSLEEWLARLRPEMRARLAITVNMGPFLGFLFVFFFIPLGIMFLYSIGVFMTPGNPGTVGLQHYAKLGREPFLSIIVRTLWFALLSTVIALVIGYPIAYYVAIRAGRYRAFLILLVLIPFWITFIIRVYALYQIFHENSPVYAMLVALSWPEGRPFLQSGPAVILGIVYTHLPFMILPLYANLVGFDMSLVEAARSLGAGRAKAFVKVTLPMTLGGIVAGSLLVFIPASGALIEPALLGGPSEMMAGLFTHVLFFQARSWEDASALSMLLIAITLILVWTYIRLTGRKEPVGLL